MNKKHIEINMADPANEQVLALSKPRHWWLVTLLSCFILLAWWSWGKIEYPMIDVGREVEISARLGAGQLLYRDVQTYYGPLAYYANALALLIFGQHLEVFYTVGLGLALAATLLVYHLTKRLTNARWAFLCTICVQIYCVLGPGLFNFMLPYSYGAAYALVLCLIAIALIDCYTSMGKLKWLIAAAIACGLAGLAKQEYGIAVLGSVLASTNLSAVRLQTKIARSLLVLAIALVCVLIPLALIAQQTSWEQVYLSLFPIPKAEVLNRSHLFQVSPAKTLAAWKSTFKIFATASLVVGGSVVFAHQIAKLRVIPDIRWFRILVEVLFSLVLAKIGLNLLSKWVFHSSTIAVFHPLSDLSWCLPVLAGWFMLSWRRFQHQQAPLLWTLLVFSLLLNARWLFYINFYGLYAVPVVILFFTLLYNLAPQTRTYLWRYLLICLLIGSSMKIGEWANYRYAVHSSHGTFYTKQASLARACNLTIQAIEASKASSILVLPEGSILTFLTATHSPVREITFLPIALPTTSDEQEFISRLQANPPNLIVYIDRPFPEWGYQNYAQFDPLVDRWITQHHRLVYTFPQDQGAIRIYMRDKVALWLVASG